MRLSFAVLIALAISVLVPTRASTLQEKQEKQEKEKKDQAGFTLSVDVELVQLPVSVLDVEGRPITGLTKDHFQVFEDGVKQEITLFKQEDVPISVGLVIDNSGSMRNKRERVNSAALAFVRESNPDDETFIVNFDDSAYLEQDFTSSIGDLIDALDNLDTRGETALNDAVFLSLEHMGSASKEKKTVLVITDGEDNASKFGFNKVFDAVREAKVTVYAIGLLEENDTRGGLFRKPPSKKAKDALTKLAEVTGGQAFFPKSLDDVEDLCKRIAHDLRNHYTIGYIPSNRKLDGTWRNVKLQLNPPKGAGKPVVRTKPGYYAPQAATTSDDGR